jgi:hypothetical protein
MAINTGDLVTVETASGGHAKLRALGPPTRGHDFLVVWVCDEEEWNSFGADAEGVPWPASSVLEAKDALV